MRRLLLRRARTLRGLRKVESGAMAIFIALTTCFVIVPLGALAVDIGMQRISRSDAQSVADTTALEMAQLMTASGASAVTSSVANTEAGQTAGTVGNDLQAYAYTGTLSTNFVSDQSYGCATPGTAPASNGYFTPTTTNPTAVLVVVTNSVNFAIHGGKGGVCRSAIARAQATACFKIGSIAAGVHSGNTTILGPLLSVVGGSIGTNLVSYEGLADTQLQLAQLATALGVGSPTQFLGSTVTLGKFVAAEANALQAQGANAAQVSVLSALALVVPQVQIPVASLLDLSSGAGNADGLTGSVNALDLLTGALEIANGSSALAVPGLNLNLVGLATATTSLSVTAPPVEACGLPNTKAASATTAQVGLTTTATLLGNLPNILGLLSVQAGPIAINVQAAQATGQLTAATCSNSGSMTVNASASLAPITIKIPITVSALGGLLGSLSLVATVTTTPTNPSSSSVTLTPVPTPAASPGSTGSGNLNVTSANVSIVPTSSNSGILGLVGGRAQLVSALTSSIVSPLLSNVVAPLLTNLTGLLQTTLGVSLVQANLWADSVTCSSPYLAG